MPTFHFLPTAEHAEVPAADHGQFEQLVAHVEAVAAQANPNHANYAVPTSDKADYVVSVSPQRDPDLQQARLREIVSLVENQGGHVVGSELLCLSQPNPKTLIGRGTAESIASRARAAGARMVVIDAALSPSQTRNLEDLMNLPVCDREAVILNVFLRRAHTAQARAQVELAQLAYLRPRIRGVGLDMDQQTGGMASARGPGETASELLARKLDNRITQLRRQLTRLATAARTQRAQTAAATRIVLVGYTNAGKTSLMNALCGASLSAADRPFETLDTTSRSLSRHGGDVLLTDTVGFIRQMPPHLLASFRSTLDVVSEASLLVVVVDVSDPEARAHLATVESVIADLGASHIPRLIVANKSDRLTQAAPDGAMLGAALGAMPLSTRSPADIAALRELLLAKVRSTEQTAWLHVPYTASQALGVIYSQCRVLTTIARATDLALQVSGAPAAIARAQAALSKEQV